MNSTSSKAFLIITVGLSLLTLGLLMQNVTQIDDHHVNQWDYM